MTIRKIIFSLILYTISLSNLFALEPDIFVQSTVNRASKILTENISKLEKMEKGASKVKLKLKKRRQL